MSTRRYLLSKVFQAILTLGFVLAFNFFLFRGIGDPIRQLLRGHNISPQAVADLNRELGLDLPLIQQFFHYVKETVTGHLGVSIFYSEPVSSVIGARVWPTVLLVGTSTIASIALGLWLGTAQGWRRGSRFDRGALGVSLFFYSMPEFWFGLLMIMALSTGIGFFPALFPAGQMMTQGAEFHGVALVVDVLNHMVLPFFVLTVSYLAEYSLIMRSSLLDTLSEDFIVTARSKGLREKDVLYRHAVPNALLPTMTITILSLGFIISGAITIELIFSWPGLGLLSYTAITHGPDFPVLQGLFLLFSASVIVANLLADLLYSYLDPRVRAG
jgi:peptide/nickel transport system permease protein